MQIYTVMSEAICESIRNNPQNISQPEIKEKAEKSKKHAALFEIFKVVVALYSSTKVDLKPWSTIHGLQEAQDVVNLMLNTFW